MESAEELNENIASSDSECYYTKNTETMGFVVGSSSISQSPLSNFLFPSSSSSSRSCTSWEKNAQIETKFGGIRAPMACSRQEEDPREAAFGNERTVFFKGIPILPLFGFRSKPLERFATNETEAKTPDDNKNHEDVENRENLYVQVAPQKIRSSYLLLSHLNGRFATICCVVLGAAFGYAAAQKERADANATVGRMDRKLKAQEDLISSLKRSLGVKAFLNKLDTQLALINQLKSAKSIIIFIEKELQKKEDLIEELKLQIENLETQLAKANAEKEDVERSLEEKIGSIEYLEGRLYLLSLEFLDKKDVVQNLSSLVAEKESELRSLKTYFEQLNDELSNSDSQISALEEKYNDLKLTSDKKAASDAKLVREKEEELHQLKQKLEHAVNERKMFMDSLENASKKSDHLKDELQISQENPGKTRNVTTKLEEHMNESLILQKELEVDVAMLLSDFSEVTEAFQRSLLDEKERVRTLTSELRTAKEDLKKSQVELQELSHELEVAHENCSSLQTELMDVYKKAETVTKDLTEEKKLVSSLTKDIQALESQVFKDRETRRSLELNMEKASKLLDEANHDTKMLSNQLAMYNSRTLRLEEDKEAVYKLLIEQKNAYEQTQKKLEDAQNFMKNLGMEKENLESKAKKLEEELGSAMGEILRLRSQKISSSDDVSNDEGESEVTEYGEENAKYLSVM